MALLRNEKLPSGIALKGVYWIINQLTYKRFDDYFHVEMAAWKNADVRTAYKKAKGDRLVAQGKIKDAEQALRELDVEISSAQDDDPDTLKAIQAALEEKRPGLEKNLVDAGNENASAVAIWNVSQPISFVSDSVKIPDAARKGVSDQDGNPSVASIYVHMKTTDAWANAIDA